MDELKADQVLQEKAKSLPNVEVFLHSQSLEVLGNGDKVTGLRVKDRKTDAERVIDLDGIFVQIGLAANSGVFRDVVETNKPGEIVIDAALSDECSRHLCGWRRIDRTLQTDNHSNGRRSESSSVCF